MKPTPTVVAWFDRGPLPEILPDPAIIVGGTGLLRQFIDLAALSSGGRLSIAAPFAGAGIRAEITSWESMRHGDLDVSLITHTRRDAAIVLRELGALPWRSLAISVYAPLHAKLYVLLTPAGAGASLIGSHNLTRAGARRNAEAGSLFLSARDPQICRLIQACDEQIRSLSCRATPFIDTLRWPAERVS